MAEDQYTEIEVGGITLRMSEEALRGMFEAGDYLKEHLAELGGLCWSFAVLDHNVDRLFEPLLQCSEAQVACIMVENISTRCSQLTKLLHLESELPEEFCTWVCKLLVRSSDEIPGQRNRYVHDRWGMKWSVDEQSVTRITKKPRIEKAQSRERPGVTFNTEHPTTVEEMARLTAKIETVSSALQVARQSLEIWRRTGELPPIDPLWLPACMPKARGHLSGWSLEEQPAQPPPSHYEFD